MFARDDGHPDAGIMEENARKAVSVAEPPSLPGRRGDERSEQQISRPLETRPKRWIGIMDERVMRPHINVDPTKEKVVEPGDTWGRGEGWASVRELIEFGKRPNGAEWNAERREQILQRVLARTERAQERRRVVHAFAAGASTIVAVGLLLGLIGVGWPKQRRHADVVGKIAPQRLAAD